MRKGVRNLHGKGDSQAKRVLDFKSGTRLVFQMYKQKHILKYKEIYYLNNIYFKIHLKRFLPMISKILNLQNQLISYMLMVIKCLDEKNNNKIFFLLLRKITTKFHKIMYNTEYCFCNEGKYHNLYLRKNNFW